MRASALLFAAVALPACSFDVESFQVLAGHDDAAQADVGTQADGRADAAPGDAPLEASFDVRAEAPFDATDPVAADCNAKGNAGTCLNCCGDGYPKGRAAVVTHADSCFCGAAVCATPCDKNFCKPGAAKSPDAACGACLRDALAGACSADVDAAQLEEPQVTPYLGCATGCR